MPDLQPFNSGETATSIRTKINAAIARINTLDDANEIIAKLDAELGSTAWKNSIITLNTIADLKAFDVGTIVDKTVAVVYGSSAAGDGEGGTFYWDQSSSQTADGITTIAPNSGDSGRWIKVQVALSGVDIQAAIVEEDTYDGSLADIGAIKDWVESNTKTSDLEYVGIVGYDGNPTRVGSVGALNGTEYLLSSNTSGETVTYNIADLQSTQGDITNIRLLHVEVSMLVGMGSADKITELKATFPDGNEQIILSNNWNGVDAVIDDGHRSVVVVPINSDTSTITFEAKIDGDTVRETIGFKIVGATVVRNASGLLGDQIYGGSGMLYSGTEVYSDTPVSNTWTELNIKPHTTKGGRTLCYFKVAGGDEYKFRPKGETADIATGFQTATSLGGGISATQNAAANISYVVVISDSDTIVEFMSNTAVPVIITLEAYQPLDDSPVVTRHYLGDIEFIDAVTIVERSDDIRTDTGWRTVQPNMAWAGASTLVAHFGIQDNNSNSAQNISFRASATGTEVSSSKASGTYGSKNSQLLIPVSSDGSWQWNFGGDNTGYLADLRVVGYIKSNPISASYPYFNVMVDQRPGLTTPSEFTDASQDTLAEYKEPSYGSIATGYNNVNRTSVNSLLYEMSVNVLTETDIIQKLFAIDDDIYIYVDGVEEAKRVGHMSSAHDPIELSYTLTAGLHTISIVQNDVGGSNELELMGDIISDTVQFVGFSGVTGILDDIKGAVNHTTVPTSLAVQEYVAAETGVPRFVGITQIDKYDQVANTEYEYDLTSFSGITPLKVVGVYVVCYTRSSNGSTGQSYVSTNLGGGETFTPIKSQYDYEDAGSSAMIMIPLSVGQTTFKLKTNKAGSNSERTRQGWTIVGVSQY